MNFPAQSSHNTRPRILVVDDDDFSLEIIGMLLEQMSAPFELFSTGAAAVQAFCSSPSDFSAGVLDYRMPGMDGIQVYQALRAARPDFKAILYTGLIPEGVPMSRLGSGLKYMNKDYSVDHLSEALHSLAPNTVPHKVTLRH